MYPLESSNPTISPGKGNITETQEDFKITIINMLKDLKGMGIGPLTKSMKT